MDTITQILLGAAVGGAVGGRRLGWIAPAAGAVGGLIPDLDVFWPTRPGSMDYWDVHRGITHSLFFGPVVGGALGFVSAKIHGAMRRARAGGRTAAAGTDARGLLGVWCAVWILSVFTHPLLDAFTIYGTQLLAPFSSQRFALAAVPIIDPVYSLTLVAALVVAWRAGWAGIGARRALVAGLALSTAYLGVGYAQHHRALAIATAEASEPVREAEVLAGSTTMFTPWFRRITVEGEDARHVGFVSTVNPQPIRWITIPRDPAAEALAREALATDEGRRYSLFASGVIHPHIVTDEAGRRHLRLGDMRYGVPGASIVGQWGLAWPLDESGAIAGEGVRYRVSPEATWGRVVALFRASFGLANEVF